MKQKLVLTAALAAWILCGCGSREQSAPAKVMEETVEPAVVEEILYPTVAAREMAEEEKQESWRIRSDEGFSSKDDTMTYSWHLDQSLVCEDLPVVEVAPYVLNGEDVRRAAEALLPGAEFRQGNVPCEWQFSDENELTAEAGAGELRYTLSANRDSIRLTLEGGGLRRAERPSRPQLDELKGRAEAMLNAMELGQWAVTEVRVEEESGFLVSMGALPVLAGADPLTVRQWEEGSCAEFEWTAGGELQGFVLRNPMHVERILSQRSAILPVEELLEKAADNLRSCGIHSGVGVYVEVLEENASLKGIVEVTQLEYGLGRVRTGEDTWCYLPVIAFLGTEEVYHADTGTPYDSTGEDPEILFYASALDGSIILKQQ